MGMNQRLMRPRRSGNARPAITVPGAQTVDWNVTDVTPKNALNLDGSVSVADADGDELEVTLAVTHGTMTIGRRTSYDNANDIWLISVPETLGAFSVTIDGFDANLNATTDTDTTFRDAMNVNCSSFFPANSAYDIGTFMTRSGGIATYQMTFDTADGLEEADLVLTATHPGVTFDTGDGTADATIVMSGTPTNVSGIMRVFDYTPEDDYAGADTLTVDAEDEHGATAVQKTVAITVEDTASALSPLVLLTPDPAYTYIDNGVTPSAADDPIQRWTNRGSLGGFYQQTSAGSRPTLKLINGAYVARGGGAHFLSSSGIDLTGVTGATMALLMKKPTSDDNGGYGAFSTNTGGTLSNFSGNANLYDTFGSTSRRNVLGPDWTSWTRYVVTTKAGEWTSRLNGVQALTDATNTVSFPGTTYLLSGLTTGSGDYLTGDIAFFGIFPELTAGEILQLEDYLALIQADLEA
jgi:hypothetical protein